MCKVKKYRENMEEDIFEKIASFFDVSVTYDTRGKRSCFSCLHEKA